jgi:carboxyl-terminal processing protease
MVEPELPDDLKAQMSAFTPKGEASLRGHLKNDSAPEAKGSISYVPKEKEKDVQLKAAIDLLHGKKIETSKKLENAAAPASAESAEVPN